jgi:beta-lactamase superfamily II metal-dependent hydrolase
MKRFTGGMAWKLAGVLTVSGMLLLAACANIETATKQAAAPVEDKAAPLDGVTKETPMRTDEVFDKDKYKGEMTIRYFYFKGEDTAGGDSILIQSPDGKNMLIDSGTSSSGLQVIKYLDKLGIDTIDIALNTHPHGDHLGGFTEILAKKKINNYYMEDMLVGSQPSVVAAMKRKNVPITTLSAGDTFKLGNEITVEVLSPAKGSLTETVKKQQGESDKDAAIVNYYAIVVKLIYKNNSFIFSGDIYKNREEELVKQYGDKLNVDFVHGNHHGWTTSNSAEWVKATSPQIAIASNNIFRNLDMMKLYDRNHVKIFTTRFNGTVLVTSDGNKLTAIPERDTSNLPPGFLKNQ